MFNRLSKFISTHKLLLISTVAVLVMSVTAAVFAFYPSLLDTKASSQKNTISKKSDKKDETDSLIVVEKKYEIKLNGGDMTLAINEAYVEPGATVSVNGYTISDPCKIEGTVDVKKPGVYEISYTFKDAKVIRKVTVADQVKPIITLKGNNKIILTVGDKFSEPGYTANDNFDGDLTSKVVVQGTVNTAKTGKYTISYTVKDSTGNSATVNRVVTVNQKLEVKQEPVEVKPPVQQYIPSMNEVGKLKFTDTGLNISGLTDIPTMQLAIFNTMTNTEVQKTPATVSGNTFQSTINLASLENGSYELMVFNGTEYKSCVDNIPTESQKIRRAKVGDKLVTMSYPSNRVLFKVENFTYQYDICINVGHGGVDSGAVNTYMKEKDLNLEVSLYEKQRYEEHGLRVYINRTSDTYGALLGNLDLLKSELKISDVKLPQSAINHGFYGSVSKIAYSNHNNSSTNTNTRGWEMLVQMSATADQLAPELKIANELDALFGITGRFYTKDYDTNIIYNKRTGAVYSFKENYAMNRYALELFNVKTVIYEGCYMSNPTEFNWYYNGGNWKKASEIKIKNYVESLGVTYIPPAQ